MEYNDWRHRRTITVLSTILAVLSAAVLVVLGIRYQQFRAIGAISPSQAAEGGVIPTTRYAYTALKYDNGTATLSFVLDQTGKWTWADEPDFPLDSAAVDAIVDQVTALKPQQTLDAQDTMESYGFDEPQATLTATTEDGSTLTLLLGKSTTDGNSHYMQMNGDESKVYIIAGTLYEALKTPIYDMCDLPDLPQLDKTRLKTITIRGAVTTNLSAASGEDGPTWVGVDDDGSKTVAALVEDLGAWSLAKCVDYKPADEAAKICGFTEPAAVLTVQSQTEGGSDATTVLTVGQPTPGKEGRYVRIGDDSTIYLMEKAYLDPLMRIAALGLE